MNARRENESEITMLLGELDRTLYRFVKSRIRSEHDARDVTQEALLRIVRSFDRYDHSRAKVQTWAMTIAKNLCIDYYRRQKPVVFLDDELLKLSGRSNVENTVIAKEFRTLLNEALDKLAPRYRQAFVMRHMEEKSHEEISQVLGLPVNTVKTHINRAKGQLQLLLAPYPAA